MANAIQRQNDLEQQYQDAMIQKILDEQTRFGGNEITINIESLQASSPEEVIEMLTEQIKNMITTDL
jgi:hypothetical protein